MFGFSFPKIILLIFIILVVWQIFKIIEKRNKLKNNLGSSDEREITTGHATQVSPPH